MLRHIPCSKFVDEPFQYRSLLGMSEANSKIPVAKEIKAIYTEVALVFVGWELEVYEKICKSSKYYPKGFLSGKRKS